ncbi:MAG: S-layer homology domain-containing protein [Dehalobacterium sp.]
MKRLLVPLLLIMLILLSLPVMGAENETLTNEILRLDKEDIENQQDGNIATFRMMNTDRTTKQLEIDDTALEYMSDKDIKLTVETDIMTFTVTPEVFKTQEWLEAVKSGEPLAIRLLIKKGSGTKVSEYFDEWYYNQIGLSRFGSSAWDLAGEILVGGIKKYDINSFAAPINISVEYSVNASSNIGGENNLGMYVLNEEEEQWDYHGGSVDQENRTVNFNTQVPGLYIILANQKSPQSFSDIKGHWAEGDIQYMVKRNVVQISGDNKFYPNNEITRAEFAVFLVRTLGLGENMQGSKSFKDVTSDKSYYHEVLAAANTGIVAGVSQDRFNPDAKITRQEMAVMLDRALKYAKVSVQPNQDLINKFTDGKQIAAWAKDSVSVAVATNLIGGRENNSFAPKSFASRAEAVVILYRFLSVTNK